MGDVIAVARVLLALPEEEWPACLERLWHEARVADSYRRRLGRPHPDWGNGSLMAVAGQRGRVPEPFLSDRRYVRALRLVLGRLLEPKLSFVTGPGTLYDGGHGRERRQRQWPKPE